MQMADIEGTNAAGEQSMDQPPKGYWRSARPWVISMVVSLAFGWTLGIVWWGVLSPDAREEITDEIVIPMGTADALRSGTGFAFVPGEISLRPGSRLIIRNNDSVEHTIGDAVVPAGTVAEITMADEEEKETFACSIHPSGFLGVRLTERPSFLTTLVAAGFIGIPSGLTIGGILWVGRHLHDEKPEGEDDDDFAV